MPDEPDYLRFSITINYIHREMVTNAQSDIVSNIRTLMEAANYAMGSGNGLLMQEAPGYAQTALEMWAVKVGPHLDWDHKPKLDEMLGLGETGDYYFPVAGDSEHEYYYDIWSNIHFGYVGTAAGIDAESLFLGANLAEAGPSGMNDPSDNLSIQIGIDLWNAYGTDLTQQQIVQAVLAHTNDYLAIQAQQSPRYLHRVDEIVNGR